MRVAVHALVSNSLRNEDADFVPISKLPHRYIVRRCDLADGHVATVSRLPWDVDPRLFCGSFQGAPVDGRSANVLALELRHDAAS